MKALDKLLGKRSKMNDHIVEIGYELGKVLGRNVPTRNGNGYRTDENGIIWLQDIDSDERITPKDGVSKYEVVEY